MYHHYCMSEDTVLSDKAIDDVQDPFWMNHALKISQHVIVPDELATWRGEGAWVGAHLALKGEGEVVRIAEVEVAGQVDVLKHLQIPAQVDCLHQKVCYINSAKGTKIITFVVILDTMGVIILLLSRPCRSHLLRSLKKTFCIIFP